jgi:hypothetical protein
MSVVSATTYPTCQPRTPISGDSPEHEKLDGRVSTAVLEKGAEHTPNMNEALPRALACLDRAGAELAQNHFDRFCGALQDTSAILEELIVAVVTAQMPAESAPEEEAVAGHSESTPESPRARAMAAVA